jgi:hypothetical protein
MSSMSCFAFSFLSFFANEVASLENCGIVKSTGGYVQFSLIDFAGEMRIFIVAYCCAANVENLNVHSVAFLLSIYVLITFNFSLEAY